MSSINSIRKFRPVLSESQISHILTLARRDNTADSIDLIRALGMYEYKIKNEILTPAYAAQIPESLCDALGFNPIPPTQNDSSMGMSVMSDEVLYNLWLQEPEALTVKQLTQVRRYRYAQGKMTIDEEKLFEKEVLGLAI